jgi:hypothetical protein
MTEDDRIDEIIRNAAKDYNRPSATPRDEMWAAIQAARQAPGPRLHVTAGGASAERAPKRFGARYTWIGMAAAAALLVATGVGIGRYTGKTPVTRVADAPAPVPVPPDDEIRSEAPKPVEPARAQPSPRDQAPPRRSPEEIKRNPIITAIRKAAPLNPAAAAANQATSNIYQVATMRHLADAEALLTTFTFESRDATMNAKIADWAKSLLSNTRLLLDSPAGDDPRRAKLLQDLELVLAQIVQLSPSAAATDRELIQGSIQEGQVITRLRTAIPASGAREILER